MKQRHVKDLLPEYLDSLLEEAQTVKVEVHLKECESCSKELAKLKTLFSVFDQEEMAIPSNSPRTNFLKQLEIEKQNATKVVRIINTPKKVNSGWTRKILKLAASIALLIGSYMLGKFQEVQKSNVAIAAVESESSNMKQIAILSLMENKSASRRIQGVNFIEDFKNPDEAIVKALVERMRNDENTNVRLTAVDALSRFAKSDIVKSAFIEALGTEKEPSIQIIIIQNLVKIQEKKALKPMRQLLEQEDTQPFVKVQIESLLPTII